MEENQSDEITWDHIRRIVFILIPVLVFLLLLEGICRLTLDFPYADETIVFEFSEIPGLIYELRPEAQKLYKGMVYRTNSAGILGKREYTHRPNRDVYRICLVGDSVTMMTDERTVAEFLEEKLNAASDGEVRFEILNFSSMGYNAEQERILINTRVLPYQPSLILVAYCRNDVAFNYGLDRLNRANHPKSMGIRLHSRLFQFLTTRLYRTIAVYTHSGHGNYRMLDDLLEYLDTIQAPGNQAVMVSIMPVLTDQEGKNDFRVRVRKRLEYYRIPYVDLYEALEGTDLTNLRLFPDDDLHMNSDGHLAAARVLAPAVLKLADEAIKSSPAP